jgi:hypothetical protein
MGYCTVYFSVKNELFDKFEDKFQYLKYPEKDEIADMDRGLGYCEELGKLNNVDSTKWFSIAGMGRDETAFDTEDQIINLVSPSDIRLFINFLNGLNIVDFDSFVELSTKRGATYKNNKWAYEEFLFLKQLYEDRIRKDEWVIIDVG